MSDTEPKSTFPIERRQDLVDQAQGQGEFKGQYLQLERDLNQQAISYREKLAGEVSAALKDRTEIAAARGKMVDLDEETRVGIFKDGWFGNKWTFRIQKTGLNMAVSFSGQWVNPKVENVSLEKTSKVDVKKAVYSVKFKKGGAFTGLKLYQEIGIDMWGYFAGDKDRIIANPLEQLLYKDGLESSIIFEISMLPTVKAIFKYPTSGPLRTSASHTFNESNGNFEWRKGDKLSRIKIKDLEPAFKDFLGRLNFNDETSSKSMLPKLTIVAKDDLDPSPL